MKAIIAPNTEDRVLIRSWQQGNERSFDRLFHRYFQVNCRYAYTLLRDRMTAEEIATDVMMSIWRRKEYIDPEAPVLPFMLKSTKNRAIDYIRQKKLPTLSFTEATYGSISLSECSVDNVILDKEMNKIYEQALLVIAPKRQRVFRMSRDFDMSYTEIAKRTNLSKNTVQNHIALALRDVHQYFNNSTFRYLMPGKNRCFKKQRSG